LLSEWWLLVWTDEPSVVPVRAWAPLGDPLGLVVVPPGDEVDPPGDEVDPPDGEPVPGMFGM
jgi:hypothetical protein